MHIIEPGCAAALHSLLALQVWQLYIFLSPFNVCNGLKYGVKLLGYHSVT